MSETEEALRLVITLGQLFIPSVQEVVKLFGRGVGWGADKLLSKGKTAVKTGLSKAKDAHDKSISVNIERGSLGWVSMEKMKGSDLDMIPMPDALKREDLAELNNICGQLGLKFSVNELRGQSCLVFEAKNAEALSQCLEILQTGYHIDPDSVIDKTEAHALTTNTYPESFKANGLEFSKVSAGKYQAADNFGKTININTDGAWSVSDEAGVVLLPSGMPLEGNVPNFKAASPAQAKAKLFGAAHIATAYSKSISNKKLMELDAKAGYQTPARVNKGVTAAAVRQSVISSRQRKAMQKGQVQKNVHALAKKRTRLWQIRFI